MQTEMVHRVRSLYGSRFNAPDLSLPSLTGFCCFGFPQSELQDGRPVGRLLLSERPPLLSLLLPQILHQVVVGDEPRRPVEAPPRVGRRPRRTAGSADVLVERFVSGSGRRHKVVL